MNEEREMVLRMLKEGKISVEEADALMQELADQQAEDQRVEEEPRGTPGPGDLREDLRTVFKDLMESIPGDVLHEIRRTKAAFRPTFGEVMRGLRGLVEGRSETTAEEHMSAGDTLELRNAWGDVHLTTVPEGTMRLRAVKRVWSSTTEEAQQEAEALPVEVRRTGSTVTVTVPRHEVGRRVRVDFEIAVPAGVAARIDVAKGDLRLAGVAGAEVRVARGDVQGSDLQGSVRADVISGDVEFRKVQGDLRLDLKSGDVAASEIGGSVEGRIINGDVALSDCRGASLDVINGDIAVSRVEGEISIATKSGDVAVAQARARGLRVRTLSGDIALDLLDLREGDVSAETVSGDIKLTLPADARATIEASTRSGRVYSALPLAEQTTGFRTLRGVLNGPGATVRLQATSGDVEVRGRQG
jgi:hypothetical protein